MRHDRIKWRAMLEGIGGSGLGRGLRRCPGSIDRGGAADKGRRVGENFRRGYDRLGVEVSWVRDWMDDGSGQSMG